MWLKVRELRDGCWFLLEEAEVCEARTWSLNALWRAFLIGFWILWCFSSPLLHRCWLVLGLKAFLTALLGRFWLKPLSFLCSYTYTQAAIPNRFSAVTRTN
ncbi:unnamed protein product, partial [Phaeothamnion confervicola]